MPTVIVVLAVLALFYQMFFRYETHESDQKTGVMIERDTLTGNEHTVTPGEPKTSLIGHIFGSSSDTNGDSTLIKPWGDNAGNSSDEPTVRTRLTPLVSTTTATNNTPESANIPVDYNDHQQVERASRPVPVPREVVIASSAPPVPMSSSMEEATPANAEGNKPFAIKQIDLNRDGAAEEIIQNATQADGLLDISIVKNGREIFFGRGKQISLLPSSSQGWSDIVLKMGAKTLQVFRYDTKDAAYRALDHKS